MAAAAQQLMTLDKAHDSVELLRQILVQEKGQDLAYEEAREIGDALVEFFEILAEAD